MFKMLLVICNILNITPENDLHAPSLPLPPFPPQLLPQSLPSPMTSVASSGNGGGRQRWWKQRQRWGHTTINQQMTVIVTETAFVAATASILFQCYIQKSFLVIGNYKKIWNRAKKLFLVRPQYAPPFFSQSSVFQIFIHCGIHNSSLWETTLLLHLPSLITINSSLE